MSDQFDVIASGFEFVEAPRVDSDGTVYFSDLIGGGLYRRRPQAPTVDTVLPARRWIGGAVFACDGSLIVSGEGGMVSVDPETGSTSPVLSEIEGVPIVAVNDIEADADGGIFGGTIDFGAVLERGETPANGQFFHIDAGGELRVLREGLVASNGLGFSPDGRWLYHSESTRGIWRYALDAGGLPGPAVLFVALEDSDGLAVDCEGCIWVACWQRALLLRLRPDGSESRRLKLPFPHVVSLTFGGQDLRDLYVTTGGDALHPAQGGMIRMRMDVPGLATHRAAWPLNR